MKKWSEEAKPRNRKINVESARRAGRIMVARANARKHLREQAITLWERALQLICDVELHGSLAMQPEITEFLRSVYGDVRPQRRAEKRARAKGEA